jgi:ATP-dependent DNA helicase PIF1
MYPTIKSLIKNKRNIFITGCAGTGKSYMLNKIKEDFPSLQLTASTGVAAVNISGSTIHSFAGIGIAKSQSKQIYHRLHPDVLDRIKDCELLAIDEISMLSAKTLNLIDEVFQLVRHNQKPFGGMQLIVVGDFLQLPPVSDNEVSKDFAFKSRAWQNAEFENIILDKVYRQEDTDFINLLNKVRFGIPIDRDSFSDRNFNGTTLKLFALNRYADQVNVMQLSNIPTAAYSYQAFDTGSVFAQKMLDAHCLAVKTLQLKVNARVMLLINKDISNALINGSTGIVSALSSHSVTVDFDNGITRSFSQEPVAKIVLNNEIVASREQIPLRLAWAISIHKAQGMTLDKVHVDMKGLFEDGQAYVALSRAKTNAGLSVANLDHKKIKANKDAVEFMRAIS